MENEKGLIKYQSGNNEIQLSTSIVKQYLVNGNGAVTDQEVGMFMALCKHQRLNPFLREAYLIKYGDKQPATMVVGKEAFLKRAVRNERYQGHETGLIEGDKIDNLRAWAKVHVKGYKVPVSIEVDYSEYVGLKDIWGIADGKNQKIGTEPNRQWKSKPRTMLRKVALLQALREAFPEDLGGMYGREEVDIDLPTETVETVASAGTEPRAKTEPSTSQRKMTASEYQSAVDSLITDLEKSGVDAASIADCLEKDGLQKNPIKARADEREKVIASLENLKGLL